MKFKVDSKYLIQVLQAVTSTTGSARVTLVADEETGIITAIANNQGSIHRLTTNIKVSSDKGGSILTVDASQVSKILSRKGEVVVEYADPQLTIRNSKFKTIVALTPPDDIPDIEGSDKVLNIGHDTLMTLSAFLPCVGISNLATDSPIMIRVRNLDGKLEMCASDMSHGVYIGIENKGQGDFSFELTFHALSTLLNTAAEDPEAILSIEENRVLILGESSSLTFPKIQGSLSTAFNTILAVKSKCIKNKDDLPRLVDIHKGELVDALNNCLVFAVDKVSVEFGQLANASPTQFRLSYISDLGNTMFKVMCLTTNHWTATARINPFVIMDTLNIIDLESITLYKQDTILFIHDEAEGVERFYVCSGN